MADIGFANVEVLSADNTKVLAINNTRVSLEKGYGLMTPIATFEVAVSDILNALDVQPVKHGYWTDLNNDAIFHYECSCCKEHTEWHEKYCPNCGARMDGESNG